MNNYNAFIPVCAIKVPECLVALGPHMPFVALYDSRLRLLTVFQVKQLFILELYRISPGSVDL